MKIYLAGPEVFLPNAREIGRAKQAICAKHGLQGFYPLDKDVPPRKSKTDWAFEIFRANRRLMDRADAVIANMTPFRGLSMDVGTSFEMGYMLARKKLVLGYSNLAGTYMERARAARRIRPRAKSDVLGLAVEDFGLGDNLMMAGAVRASGFEVFATARRRLNGLELYSDLELFERCVRALRER